MDVEENFNSIHGSPIHPTEQTKIVGLTGAFWQRDVYNHIIRSKKEYHFQNQ